MDFPIFTIKEPHGSTSEGFCWDGFGEPSRMVGDTLGGTFSSQGSFSFFEGFLFCAGATGVVLLEGDEVFSEARVGWRQAVQEGLGAGDEFEDMVGSSVLVAWSGGAEGVFPNDFASLVQFEL